MRKITHMWRTKNGRNIRICDMDDQHLENTIKMLERVHIQRRLYLWDIALSMHGEMASYCAEGEASAFSGMSISDHFPIYDDLVKERERRKEVKGDD